MRSREDSNKTQKDAGDWRASLDKDLLGAGYFMSQTDPIQFDALAYLRWRNADKATTLTTVRSEWGRWLRYFRDCSGQRLRERAIAATPMDLVTLTTYFEEKLNAERVVDLLGINNDQLLLTGNEQTRALRRQFGKQNSN